MDKHGQTSPVWMVVSAMIRDTFKKVVVGYTETRHSLFGGLRWKQMLTS